MKQTITVYGEPYEVDQTVAGYIDNMQDEIKSLRARVGVIPESEKCWNCGRLVNDTTDTPFCDWCPVPTAQSAIRYLEQACDDLYAHVPYRIADDVKEKATVVIDFLRAKETAPVGDGDDVISRDAAIKQVNRVYGCSDHDQPTHCADCALRHKVISFIKALPENTRALDTTAELGGKQ